MQTAGGFSALLRGFRLALTVEGLRPHTIHSYLRDVERFAEYVGTRHPCSIFPSDMKLASSRMERQPAYGEAEVKRLLLACHGRTPPVTRDRSGSQPRGLAREEATPTPSLAQTT